MLLELKPPKVDGLEILPTIRTEPELRRWPVLIRTSSREQEDVVPSYDLGVNACVETLLGFNEFIHAIQELGIFGRCSMSRPGSLQPKNV